MSLELLGAEPARGILIKVKNAQQLAASQGGTAGAIAATIVPGTIEGIVLDKMVQQFRTSLRQAGVEADVQAVSATQGPATSGFGFGVAAGVGLAGLGLAAWRYGVSKLF